MSNAKKNEKYDLGEGIARQELNVIFVIDNSGSMSGEKIGAVNNAIRKAIGLDYSLEHYTQHALEEKSTSQAAAYVGIRVGSDTYWGAGIDSDIIESSVRALVSAVNRMLTAEK